MKNILYLGLELPNHQWDGHVVHCPLIKIVPRSKDDLEIVSAFSQFQEHTHLIFTSKPSVAIFMEYARHFGVQLQEIRDKCIVAVGKQTAAKIASFGLSATIVASNETGEGVIEELSRLTLINARVFWPHSSLSRTLIANWLTSKQILHLNFSLYDTVPRIPSTPPDLALFDEIVFTSPSVVDAFLLLYKTLPSDKILTSIGPITHERIKSRYRSY